MTRECGRYGTPYTLRPTPYTQHLHPTPDTLHSTPYTLHPTPPPDTQHPTPCTLHPTPCTLHPTPHTLHLTPCTLLPPPAPDILNSTSHTTYAYIRSSVSLLTGQIPRIKTDQTHPRICNLDPQTVCTVRLLTPSTEWSDALGNVRSLKCAQHTMLTWGGCRTHGADRGECAHHSMLTEECAGHTVLTGGSVHTTAC